MTTVSGAGVMAAQGAEVWMIDGQPFQIRATYYLSVTGGLQFTADYACADRCPDFGRLTDEGAFVVAYPVMKHILTQRLYTRAQFTKNGKQTEPQMIGVAITQAMDGGRDRGYRVSRTLDQIRAALNAGGPEAAHES